MSKSELRATFILRLWRERSAPAGEWRGEVEYVQPAYIARFGDRAALFAFIWSQLAELEKGTTKESCDNLATD
ncbi:MAG: hypothetical protein L0332_05595 [Chloroflexi bacterium]|nr:hypothetical protein [Chloroflexota bacterium]MCI0645168.1 hypothetical protein [Chloroflexota bacterium]MCI0726182.1 hypothetical protein [Chloroflexota bacterium]